MFLANHFLAAGEQINAIVDVLHSTVSFCFESPAL